MIKRLRFVTRRAGLSATDFSAAWVAAVTVARNAPENVRPLRAVACTTLHDVQGTDVPHDGISTEWFADIDALRRFESWLASEDRQRAASIAAVVEPSQSATFVAEEHVLRGADWLGRRWAQGGIKLKHMALARRALGLTAEEYSGRWRNKAGTVGGAKAPAVAIPEPAKGLAYVQNHAIEDRGRYDAVNEVYFEDLEAMRARIEFFAKIDAVGSDPLISEASFVAVSERVV